MISNCINYISLIINKVGHLFTWLCSTHFPSVKCLFMSFAQFCLVVYLFLLTCKTLYILDFNILSGMFAANIFSQFITCLLTFFFYEKKLIILMESNLSIFSLSLLYASYLRTIPFEFIKLYTLFYIF